MTWTEELTTHLLEIDAGALRADDRFVDRDGASGEGSDGSDGGRDGRGGPADRGAGDGAGRSENVSSSRERSLFVHSRFQLPLDDRNHEGAGVGRALDSLVPAGIDALVRESLHGTQVSSMEVMYTRGNTGLYRMPSWYVQRGAGLVVRAERAEGVGGGEDEGWRDVLVVIGRMLGSSAGSIFDRTSYVVGNVKADDTLSGRKSGALGTSHAASTSFSSKFQGWSTQDFPCVESIQRWMRLLPCGGQAGISEVMHGLRLLELPYHSIRVAIEGGLGERMLTVELSGIVHEKAKGDAVEMMASRNRLMNRQRTGQGEEVGEEGFVQGLIEGRRACPVVGRSVYRDCDEDTGGEGGMELLYVDVSSYLLPRRGEEMNPLLGTLESVVRMQSREKEAVDRNNTVRLVYRQALPWEMVIDAPSLVVRGGGRGGQMVPEAVNVTSISWIEARGREHGGLLEVDIDVDLERWVSGQAPDGQALVVGLNIERPILSVFDYPPDMSRGIDIPAPEVTVTLPDSIEASGICSSRNVVRAAGQNILLQLPIPDASMPFNVACFTATLLSLLFGSAMPVLLWDKEELKKVQSQRKSLKARFKRLTIALLIGGVALTYLDLSTRAAVFDAVGPVLKTLGFDLGL